MREFRYTIHGVHLTGSTNVSSLAAMIHSLLQDHESQSSAQKHHIEVHLHEVPHVSDIPYVQSSSRQEVPSRNTHTGSPFKPYTIYQEQSQLIIDWHHHGLIRVDGNRGRADGFIIHPDSQSPEELFAFFTVPLVELLRWKGLYLIHAVVLEKHGKGLVMVSPAGGGKTTNCLALLRTGYRFISDDFPILRENGNGIEALSLSGKIALRKRTASFFPEWQPSKQSDERTRPLTFHVEEIFPNSMISSCHPDVLMFPCIHDQSRNYLDPISKREALQELLQQGLLLHNKVLAKQELQMMSRIVEHATCYRLYVGANPIDLPQLIDPVMKTCAS